MSDDSNGVHQTVVPDIAIDDPRNEMTACELRVRCCYGMAVMLGEAQFAIAETVELER